MNLEHVAINVPDPVGMARWWGQHLGMRTVLSSDQPPHMHFIYDDNGSMLELYCNTAAPMPDYANVHTANLHIAFASAAIEADRARVIAAGATPVGEISTTPAGDKLCFLRDPWHVPFQFVQRKQPLV